MWICVIKTKLFISRLLYELLTLFNAVDIKAQYAKDKLGSSYKCICIDKTYFVVPSCDRNHTFDEFFRITWQTPNQKSTRCRTGLKLYKIPHGPSELIAWSEAYDKILNYQNIYITTTKTKITKQ